jgi:hypothetical protein
MWHFLQEQQSQLVWVICQKLSLQLVAKLSSRIQPRVLHQLSENEQAVHFDSPRKLLVRLPVCGTDLNFLVTGELGSFHCMDTHFDLVW